VRGRQRAVTRLAVLLALVLAFVATACIPGGGPAVAEALVGRAFLSTSVAVDGAERPLVPGTRVRLDFRDGANLGASAGCNHFGASWRLDGGALIVDGGAMTEMGCDEPRHEQDDWLFGLLASRPTVTLAGNDLTLTAGTTTIRLVDREVAEPDLPLAGPLWTVDGFVDGETAMSAPAGAAATLQFAPGGEFELIAGCNRGTGTATVGEDGTIRLGPVALTRMACPGAAGELERMVLAVLQADSLDWLVDGSRLTLTAGDQGVTFVAS
jgi:heat shock protein HslJ